VTHKLDCLFFP